MADPIPFSQKQLDILTAFQNPQTTVMDEGIGSTVGKDLLNLPTNTGNSLMGSINALANMGGSEEGRTAPYQLPNVVTPPQMTQDTPESTKISHLIAGGILPELAAVLIPYAGISKVAKVAGATGAIADVAGQVGTGLVSGAREGPGEMARQATVFGALGPISRISSPLLRIGAAGAVATGDYALTQASGASQASSLGQSAFDLLAGSIPHGRSPDFANLQTPDIVKPSIDLPIDQVIPPPPINRGALRIDDGRFNTGPTINIPARVNPILPSDLSAAPEVQGDILQDFKFQPRPEAPLLPTGLEESLPQSRGKLSDLPEYRRTQGGNIAGDSSDIYRTLLASGLSGAAGGAAGGLASDGNENAVWAGVAAGLAVPWLHKALLADAAERSPIFQTLKESGAIGGPAFRLPNGEVIKGSKGQSHFNIVDQIPNSVNPTQIERGFINSDGEFLTAQEANAEALLSGQINKKTFRDNAQTRTLGLQSEQINPEDSFATPFGSERASVGNGGSEKEKVISAAIKDDKGKVHTGPTHGQIIEELAQKNNTVYDDVDYGEFGFQTNKGRFITQKESLQFPYSKNVKGGNDTKFPFSEQFKTIDKNQDVNLVVGQSNLSATIEKNISDAKMMQPDDPEGFLRKMADAAKMKGNQEAASNFEAAIASLQKKIPEVSNTTQFKPLSNDSASTSIHALLPLAVAGTGAIAGYEKDGVEGAVTGAIIGGLAGLGGARILDRLQLSTPKSPIELVAKNVKTSVKAGVENALNSPAKDLGGQDVYGRGGILPKVFRQMENLFNLGLPAELHSAITRARGFASEIVDAGNNSLKKALKFNPPDDIKVKVNQFLNGELLTPGEQDIFLKENGVIDSKQYKNLSSTEKEGYQQWTKPPIEKDVPGGKVYVPDGVKDKYLTLQEKKFLEQIPEDWKEFASLQIEARRSMNSFQRTIRDALPDGFLRDKIEDSIGRYVPRMYRMFTDAKHNVTEEQINKAAVEFGLTKSSAEINDAINSKKAKTTEDFQRIMETLAPKSDLASQERKERLGKFVPVDVGGKSYHVLPEIAESLKKFSNEDFLRNEVRSYLAEVKGNRQSFGAKGIDKTLFTEREDMGPAYRDMLGEYTDPTERMAMGLQKMYAPSQAAKILDMARDMKIDDLPISFSGDKWAALNSSLKEEIATTADKSKIASLQSQVDKLNAYKKLPTDIKFGEFSGLYVHRFLSDYFQNDGRIWDTGIGRGISAFNTFFKTAHVPLNPVTQIRQIISMPVFAVIGKATPASMMQALDAYRGKIPDLNRELIREGIWTADFIRGEVKGSIDNIMNGRYDSTLVQGLNKFKENILEAYRIPDMMTRGGTYLAAKSRIALQMGLEADHPKVIKRAVEWTDRYTMNYDNLNRATRIARNIPFVNPFISFQSEMLRILKNLSVDAAKGNVERLAVLGGIVALPELAMKVGEQALTPPDQKQWEKMKSQLPPYMRESFLVPVAKLQNGKFKFVSISPIIPTDNFHQAVKALGKGDTDAFMSVNPFFSSDRSPLFNLISESVTGESRQTGLKYRDTKEQLSSMVSEILPPLAPGGYEWNKLANVNVENLRSGKVENWGDIALRYTIGLSAGVLKPDAVERNGVSKLKQDISNLRAYYLREVQTTEPDDKKMRAYNDYRQGVELLIHDFAEKHQPD